jgi:tRNA (cmo5U34)-methyltransferase
MKKQTENKTDQIYADLRGQVHGFVFDDAVASVFPDMISRSVPGYHLIIPMLAVFADRFVTPGSRCFDLGCSLGASSLAICEGVQHKDYRVSAVDNSQAMIDRFNEILAGLPKSYPVDAVPDDLRNVAIENASLVVMNFTLQFIPAAERAEIIRRIYQGLNPGGALVLSEKIQLSPPASDEFIIGLHHHFKKFNGYSDLEISQKRTALENVLIPETASDHISRLRKAGFTQTEMWFQCFNFASFIAVKK